MRFLSVIIGMLVVCVSAGAAGFIPTVTNPGFEDGTTGWSWQVSNGAQVSFELDTKSPHSGKQCLVFTSASGIAPHVYGRFSTWVNVVPSASYELSCWVRGEDVGEGVGSSHITDWNSYMLDFPGGTYGWQKISTVFMTRPDQQSLNLGINITNTCKALAIDDISLRPLGGQLNGDGLTGIILVPITVIGHDTKTPICVLLESSSRSAVSVEAVISDGKTEFFRKRSKVRTGENKAEWEWNTGKSPFGKYNCAVRVLDADGKVLASGNTAFEVVDSPTLDDLDRVEARMKDFNKLYAQCKASGVRLDYPATTKTMIDQFLPIARQDVRSGYEYRAKWAVTDFNNSIDDAITAMQLYLSEPKLAPVTKRYQTGNVAIDGLSFIGDRVDSFGVKDRGPLFFCGYGHFSQARTDMPRWPGYGVNIIQAAEFGPAHVFPTEDKVDLTQVRTLIRTLDSAARNNVRVDFLLSPHYFPAWAMKKYPQLGKGGGGFLGFCVDDPAAKQIVERFIRIVIPMIKNKPALNSICLTNEPVFNNIVNCDNTKQLWVDYLTRTHGDVATLNKRYGTSYASFADVPYGGGPQAYDWIVYDQQRFVAWHKWMADIIHEIAPKIPLHAKVMSTALNPGAISFGTDHELFANALEINGNDCYEFPSGNPDWPMDPWLMNTSYDLQRSFARKPIFNSENHIAPDGSNYYIAPEHFRTALWQGAIHGQGATTIWVWEHAFDNHDGFIGSVMDRPGCAQAVGTTCLDLNRFADEVTALENAKAPVAIVYSMSSMIRNPDAQSAAVMRAYYALNFCGIKIDFISEKQLAEGKGAEYKLIVFPEVGTITEAAFEGIKALPATTRLMLIGDCLANDQYGKARSADSVKPIRDRATSIPSGDAQEVLWPALRKELGLVGGLPEITLVDAKTGEPIWGVEWLPVTFRGKTIVNTINLRGKPYDVKLMKNGSRLWTRDLLSLTGQGKVTTLKPLTPVLAEVR